MRWRMQTQLGESRFAGRVLRGVVRRARGIKQSQLVGAVGGSFEMHDITGTMRPNAQVVEGQGRHARLHLPKMRTRPRVILNRVLNNPLHSHDRPLYQPDCRLFSATRIFELQEFNIGSLLVITGLFPLTWLATPFLRPSLRKSAKHLCIVAGF